MFQISENVKIFSAGAVVPTWEMFNSGSNKQFINIWIYSIFTLEIFLHGNFKKAQFILSRKEAEQTVFYFKIFKQKKSFLLKRNKMMVLICNFYSVNHFLCFLLVCYPLPQCSRQKYCFKQSHYNIMAYILLIHEHWKVF